MDPPDGWMRCLRSGNRIWLCKEKRTARIVVPFIPPELSRGGFCGDLVFRHEVADFIDNWMVRPNGNGIDGRPLVRPMKGHLPSVPIQLMSKEYHELNEKIGLLERRLKGLELKLEMVMALK
jgi:hypothetical protein